MAARLSRHIRGPPRDRYLFPRSRRPSLARIIRIVISARDQSAFHTSSDSFQLADHRISPVRTMTNDRDSFGLVSDEGFFGFVRPKDERSRRSLRLTRRRTLTLRDGTLILGHAESIPSRWDCVVQSLFDKTAKRARVTAVRSNQNLPNEIERRVKRVSSIQNTRTHS